MIQKKIKTPNTAEEYYINGRDLMEAGRYEEALDNFNSALEEDSGYIWSYIKIALIKGKYLQEQQKLRDKA